MEGIQTARLIWGVAISGAMVVKSIQSKSLTKDGCGIDFFTFFICLAC